MHLIPQIFENILLLSFMGLGFYLVERSRRTLGDFAANVLIGVCLGLTTLLVTATPVVLSDGATIDARAGPVILAGIIAGPVGGLIAATMGAVARGVIGGNLAVSGVVAYFVYAVMGVGLRSLGIVSAESLSKLRSVAIIVAASLCGASLMFFLIRPMSLGISWLRHDLPFILLANTLSVSYAVLIFGLAITVLKKSREVIEVNRRLNLARRAGRFGIWDYDITTDHLQWDERSSELHGIAAESFVGTFADWRRNVHPEDLDKTTTAFNRALIEDESFDIEYRVLLPDGRQKSIKGDAVVLRDSTGKPLRVVGSNIDLTDIRTAEAKLVKARSMAEQAQKFETIGQLTGGVAHDFNNLLAVIVGSLDLLRFELQADSLDAKSANALIDASMEASNQASELIQNMLAYARRAQLAPVLVDINEVVRETDSWISRTISSRIEIVMDLQPDLWLTRVDKSSLQSALVNLLVNARDAVDEAGLITVRTSNVHFKDIDLPASAHEQPATRYVMLAVIDSGSGMTPETVDKMFDPFFTTKPAGQGTGLGLSMVQGFVKQSNGLIKVDTALAGGTGFRLYFPAVDDVPDDSDTVDSSVSRSMEHAQSNARILLVEDKSPVRDVLHKILATAGFDVVTAGSGDEAFALYQRDSQFDLVVSDIVMPGELQGPSLAVAIRETYPNTRFIFISGYASETAVCAAPLRAGDRRLMKPIASSELIRAIEAALATPLDDNKQ